ncbi:hypothetical protein [Jatrophihabitans sp. GAS493]|uniref:hypothetical protein n=1 Tax=Jatrophihabitans sp. GAS493 TaxID=1907575 RepID=UPI000BB72568|nr:hypothetical protein [Jatrophihabitans sp. GAS493]
MTSGGFGSGPTRPPPDEEPRWLFGADSEPGTATANSPYDPSYPAGPVGVDFAEAYRIHSLAIARLSVLLTDDRAHAAQVTQAAFVALDLHLSEFGDLADALGYLQRKVIEKARIQRRHEKHPPPVGDPLIDALRALPGEQREAMVLGHWAGLGQADSAELLEVPLEEVERLNREARASIAAALGIAPPTPMPREPMPPEPVPPVPVPPVQRGSA